MSFPDDSVGLSLFLAAQLVSEWLSEVTVYVFLGREKTGKSSQFLELPEAIELFTP